MQTVRGVKGLLRETCLRCEQNGEETALVQSGHWGFCPIHEPQHVAGLRPPTFLEALERAGIAPQLKDKGIRNVQAVH